MSEDYTGGLDLEEVKVVDIIGQESAKGETNVNNLLKQGYRIILAKIVKLTSYKVFEDSKFVQPYDRLITRFVLGKER